MNFVFYNGKVYNTREFRGLARRKIIDKIVDMCDRWPYIKASDLAGLTWDALVDEYREMEENPNVTEIDKLIALAESEKFQHQDGLHEIRVISERCMNVYHLGIDQNISWYNFSISKYNFSNDIVPLYEKEFVNEETGQEFFCWSLEP